MLHYILVKEQLIFAIECCQHCKRIIPTTWTLFDTPPVLTSWLHLTLTFILEYDLPIGKMRRHLFNTPLLSVPHPVLSLYPPSLSNSLTLNLPSAYTSLSLSSSLLFLFALHLFLITFLSPLSVSFS